MVLLRPLLGVSLTVDGRCMVGGVQVLRWLTLLRVRTSWYWLLQYPLSGVYAGVLEF